jgi:TatD DNase family protein
LEKIFLETDDAEADIRDIYKSAARIKNIAEKEVVLQLEKNFLTVFNQ